MSVLLKPLMIPLH